MTSYFDIIEQMGQNQRRRICFVQFARWRHQSDIRKRCLVVFARVAAQVRRLQSLTASCASFSSMSPELVFLISLSFLAEEEFLTAVAMNFY